MNVLDLFSGIGGFSLGLERAGMKTVAFCEIDKKAQLVLKKHWPNVPIFDDVSTLKKEDIREPIDVICGGFPCQDISLAGRGAGLEGKRSGLWYEFHRLIKEIKPRYAIIENVSALRSRGLDKVLWSLAEIGYDAEWHCIPASAVGAPHQRDRIWIVAYPNGTDSWGGGVLGNIDNEERGTPEAGREGLQPKDREPCSSDIEQGGAIVADTRCSRILQRKVDDDVEEKSIFQRGVGWDGLSWREEGKNMANPAGQRLEGTARQIIQGGGDGPTGGGWSITGDWSVEPNVGRVANGVPNRVDRLKQLGNAVVPQIPEIIGRMVMQHHVSIIQENSSHRHNKG